MASYDYISLVDDVCGELEFVFYNPIHDSFQSNQAIVSDPRDFILDEATRQWTIGINSKASDNYPVTARKVTDGIIFGFQNSDGSLTWRFIPDIVPIYRYVPVISSTRPIKTLRQDWINISAFVSFNQHDGLTGGQVIRDFPQGLRGVTLIAVARDVQETSNSWTKLADEIFNSWRISSTQGSLSRASQSVSSCQGLPTPTIRSDTIKQQLLGLTASTL